MKRIRRGFSILVILALLFTLAPMIVQAADGGIKVLLIQDENPWGHATNLTVLDKIGASYDVVTYLAATTLDFSSYSMIITANGQNYTNLQQLISMKSKLEQYVNDGGIVLYNVCHAPSITNFTIPGNIEAVWEIDNNNIIVDYTHPIVTGELTNNVPLTDSMLFGNHCSHIYFQPSTFPAGTRIILQNTNDNPTLIEYSLGKGMIIASGLPWEENYMIYLDKGFSFNAMEDYFLYGIKNAGTLPESITLDTEAVTLLLGETRQLTATVLPEDAIFSAVTWESSNPAVATVSETGLITAVAEGEAIITAKTGNGLSAICTVTVVDKHTVTFKDWDGTVLKIEEVNNGLSATAPETPPRTGYTFIGWDVDFSNVTSDLIVTALYEINKYTVTFVTYDGSTVKTQIVEHGSSATAPDPPTRAGHVFIGWDVDFSNIISDLTVTALWVPYLELAAESGTVTLTASLKAGADLPATENAQLILAVYDANGRMLSFTIASVSFNNTLVVETVSATLPEGAFAKGFLWNAESIPLIEAVALL